MAVTNIADQLRRDEGLKYKPYTDTRGKVSIGYGYNLTDNGISLEIAELWLARKLAGAQTAVSAKLPWSDALDQTRRAVLWNMAYNMGIDGLLEFRNTLQLICGGNYAAAAKAMLDSAWAKEVGDRAVRLAQQMETGEWV